MNRRLGSGDSSVRSVDVILLHPATHRQMSFCAPRRSTKIRDFGRSVIFGGRMTFPGLWTAGRFLLTRNGRRKNDDKDTLLSRMPFEERLEVRGLRMGDEIVNLKFQRIGDRLMASTANPIPESVRVIVSV